MGLKVALETERGGPIEEVGDPTNLLHRLLPSYDDVSSQFLRFIDWYGDTVFNRLQMEGFIAEWKKLSSKAQTVAEKELLSRVESLARRCQNEPHLYVKIYGD